MSRQGIEDGIAGVRPGLFLVQLLRPAGSVVDETVTVTIVVYDPGVQDANHVELAIGMEPAGIVARQRSHTCVVVGSDVTQRLTMETGYGEQVLTARVVPPVWQNVANDVRAGSGKQLIQMLSILRGCSSDDSP